MSTTELDRRELASIRAGLKLLHKVAGQTSRNFSMCRLVDAISSENDTIDPLTDAEIDDLIGRLAILLWVAQVGQIQEVGK